MTERWVSLVGRDNMRLVVSGCLLEVTECWGPVSDRDLTDTSSHEWNLTGNDQTLVLVHPVTSCSAFGHNLSALMTIEIR